MTTNEGEDLSSDYFNSNDQIPREWRPIEGVGEITDEQFVGNYMIDVDQSVNHFSYNSFSTHFI